jgi:hypothetical protein
MPTGFRRRGISALTAMLAGVGLAGATGSSAMAGSVVRPNLAKASAYLVAPARLTGGHYYMSFGHKADFGLTIDGALALAATGDQDKTLKQIVSFLAGGRDAAGKTINYWTGIGTRYASGGAIGKEALLAEVVGANPHDFGGRNLIAALDASICPQTGAGGTARCPASGSYSYASSVFDQALGVMAQLRARQRRDAIAAVRYLETLQHANGSFPSLIPGAGGGDVDSTAIAAMALALVPGHAAAADVNAGVAWIASRQEPDGGFPGAGGDSVNSAGLAIQAMMLRPHAYRPGIAAAEKFLADEQNADGGFNLAAAGQSGSDLRASTQAVSGSVGIPFGSLRHALTRQSAAGSGSGSGVFMAALFVIVVSLALIAVAFARRRRRQRRNPGASAEEIHAAPVARSRR